MNEQLKREELRKQIESNPESIVGMRCEGFKFEVKGMRDYDNLMGVYDDIVGKVGEIVYANKNIAQIRFNGSTHAYHFPINEIHNYIVLETENIYTCKDFSEGRVACVNDGTIEELQTVLEYCFPDDSQIANGTSTYYMRWSSNYAKWNGCEKEEIENIPTQSVKVFLKEIELEEATIKALQGVNIVIESKSSNDLKLESLKQEQHSSFFDENKGLFVNKLNGELYSKEIDPLEKTPFHKPDLSHLKQELKLYSILLSLGNVRMIYIDQTDEDVQTHKKNNPNWHIIVIEQGQNKGIKIDLRY